MKNLFEEMDMCFRIEVVASPSFVWFVLAVRLQSGQYLALEVFYLGRNMIEGVKMGYRIQFYRRM